MSQPDDKAPPREATGKSTGKRIFLIFSIAHQNLPLAESQDREKQGSNGRHSAGKAVHVVKNVIGRMIPTTQNSVSPMSRKGAQARAKARTPRAS